MIQLLFGNLKYRSMIDLIVLPIKYLYVLYTLPCLVFMFGLYIRSGGALTISEENVGKFKIALYRASVFILSFGLWIGITIILEGFSTV